MKTLKKSVNWNNIPEIIIFANRNVIHKMKMWQIGIENDL